MTEFSPHCSMTLIINTLPYEFLPHPLLADEVYKVVREQAVTYQLRRQVDNTLWALKVSNPGYRSPQIERKTEQLRRYVHLSGLQVARRICLTRSRFPELISLHPGLEYALLMPWIEGKTWAGYMDDAAASANYTQQDAQELALTTAHVLWSLETNHLVHADIAGDNVIIINFRHIELIDLENLCEQGSTLPGQPSRGWQGYQHPNLDERGNCRPEGDRYAGAMLLTEMLTWWKPLVRALTDGDALFQFRDREPPEVLTRRLKVVRSALREISPGLQYLFDQAWNSSDLEICPDFATWVMYLLNARIAA
ncbi:MAG TPA: hypothetical protein VFB60_29105 [Ktedonobacteraceae bacterium]|nr:hypothetical protein [Ktedonobacteraceae bacterium]